MVLIFWQPQIDNIRTEISLYEAEIMETLDLLEEFLNDLLEHLYLGGEKDTFKKGAEKSKKMACFCNVADFLNFRYPQNGCTIERNRYEIFRNEVRTPGPG